MAYSMGMAQRTVDIEDRTAEDQADIDAMFAEMAEQTAERERVIRMTIEAGINPWTGGRI